MSPQEAPYQQIQVEFFDQQAFLIDPKATSLNFDLTGSGIDMQRTCSDGFNWRYSQAQALNDVSGQDWDSAIVVNPQYNGSDFRKVRLKRFACADSC